MLSEIFRVIVNYILASRESSAARGLPDSSSSIGVLKLESDSTDEHKGV